MVYSNLSKTATVPGIILLPEKSRRMQEMSRMLDEGMDIKNMFPEEFVPP